MIVENAKKYRYINCASCGSQIRVKSVPLRSVYRCPSCQERTSIFRNKYAKRPRLLSVLNLIMDIVILGIMLACTIVFGYERPVWLVIYVLVVLLLTPLINYAVITRFYHVSE